MDLNRFERIGDTAWRLPATGRMRVPAIIYGSAGLVAAMDDKVAEQAANVAQLPGIVEASYAMPDAHWGYGFPIGGVAAFDPEEGGVISAGGVGFDVSCGVRTLHTGLDLKAFAGLRATLADALFASVPAGVGSTGAIRLTDRQMTAMLSGGARWAVSEGFGDAADLAHIEERGCVPGAEPEFISAQARKRQRHAMGTLGSGNHYLEVQHVVEIFDPSAAAAFGVSTGQVLVSIHCGSRGLGHQVGTEYLREMAVEAGRQGIYLPERELACAPIRSGLGQRYLGAMRSAINCALANRQIITHLAREVFADILPGARLELLYDVSHNTCKAERHGVNGSTRELYVHRKGATRAFGPRHPDLPPEYAAVGQPVLIGGSMGTSSYILAGTREGETLSFSSACHGAGRSMSRHAATRQWQGRAVVDELVARGIEVRSPSLRGIAEEAPGAYKDVSEVVQATHAAGLARMVARVEPVVCVKG
jgi:tRNA-splicing ligase RtcB (3'-phosphate/5'-hydroxy nucleic acid ligase)